MIQVNRLSLHSKVTRGLNISVNQIYEKIENNDHSSNIAYSKKYTNEEINVSLGTNYIAEMYRKINDIVSLHNSFKQNLQTVKNKLKSNRKIKENIEVTTKKLELELHQSNEKYESLVEYYMTNLVENDRSIKSLTYQKYYLKLLVEDYKNNTLQTSKLVSSICNITEDPIDFSRDQCMVDRSPKLFLRAACRGIRFLIRCKNFK